MPPAVSPLAKSADLVAAKKNKEDPGTLFALIQHDLSKLTSLTYLSVYDSEITTLMGIEKLARVDNLRELNLGCNPISEVPPGLALLQSLATLSMDDCLLSAFPAPVANLSSLEELRMSGNAIGELTEGDIGGMAGLRLLNMDNNKIQTFPQGLKFESLSLLSLRANGLTAFPTEMFRSTPALEFLALSSNKIRGFDLPLLVRECGRLQKVYVPERKKASAERKRGPSESEGRAKARAERKKASAERKKASAERKKAPSESERRASSGGHVRASSGIRVQKLLRACSLPPDGSRSPLPPQKDPPRSHSLRPCPL
jgi:hypothetical protein